MKLDKKTVVIVVLLIVAAYLILSRQTSGFGAHDCPKNYIQGASQKCYKCPNGTWLEGSKSNYSNNGSMCCVTNTDRRTRGLYPEKCETNPSSIKKMSWYWY